MLIGLAGPTANFILAFVLMLFYFGWINEVPAVEVKDTTVDWVVPGSAAAETGIEPGDTILRFADADHPDWEKVDEILNLNSKQTVPVTVERRGKVLQLALHVPSELNDEDLAGMLPQLLPGPIGVVKVEPETPAEQAGLRAGDAIQSVDGHPFHYVTSLLAYMQTGQGKPISLVILRNGAVLAPILAHPAKLDDGWKLGFVPQAPSYRRDPLPLGRAVNKSAAFFADKSIAILDVLRGLFTHKVAISHLAGPVGIARVAGDAAESKGWMAKIWLAAFISINLGIINLLPFPILDGGGIIFLLIESVMRRDINIVVKERIYQAAFVVLVTFFVFITFNDITKLPIFTHLKP
jgi:regulator of sigma E protease